MKKAYILLLVAFCCSGFQTVGAQAKITAIQARLFYNENDPEPEKKKVSGSFSPNIIDNPEVVLWNTIIGEGSAEGYSNQTLVVVEVSKGLAGNTQSLKLTATAGKRTLLSQVQSFSTVYDKATYKLAFLLNDTGCEEIKLKADLIQKGKVISSMTKTIPFACGE